MPPFVAWRDFYRMFAESFKQGEHVTAVGGTGSGKTVLNRHVILLRAYVIVMATKLEDDSLYKPLQREGFVIVEEFDPDPYEEPRVILKPPQASIRDKPAQDREIFDDALQEIWNSGKWCVFADEIRYLTDNLKLDREFETLWLQGRSLGVSIVCATQRPVGIPLEAFSQATHLFLFRENDQRNIDRMAEFTAGDKELAKYVIPRLPRYEALYIDTRSGYMARTKVTA